MKQVHLFTDFDCCGKVYPVDVNISIEENGHTLRFNFRCHTHELPDDMKAFDVITTPDRQILFNRLVSIQGELEPNLLECVRKFVKELKHPELPEVQ